jgi:hypothetical protein
VQTLQRDLDPRLATWRRDAAQLLEVSERVQIAVTTVRLGRELAADAGGGQAFAVGPCVILLLILGHLEWPAFDLRRRTKVLEDEHAFLSSRLSHK